MVNQSPKSFIVSCIIYSWIISAVGFLLFFKPLRMDLRCCCLTVPNISLSIRRVQTPSSKEREEYGPSGRYQFSELNSLTYLWTKLVKCWLPTKVKSIDTTVTVEETRRTSFSYSAKVVSPRRGLCGFNIQFFPPLLCQRSIFSLLCIHLPPPAPRPALERGDIDLFFGWLSNTNY